MVMMENDIISVPVIKCIIVLSENGGEVWHKFCCWCD